MDSNMLPMYVCGEERKSIAKTRTIAPDPWNHIWRVCLAAGRLFLSWNLAIFQKNVLSWSWNSETNQLHIRSLIQEHYSLLSFIVVQTYINTVSMESLLQIQKHWAFTHLSANNRQTGKKLVQKHYLVCLCMCRLTPAGTDLPLHRPPQIFCCQAWPPEEKESWW